MVKAEGLGTRMRPLTNDRPKALVTVAHRTLIDHVLDRLVEADVERAVVNVHAFADMLETHLKRRRDIEIVISDERDRLMETGGGVRKALPLLGDAPFFVCNIDSVWDEPLGSCIARLARGYDHEAMGARLLLAAMEDQLGYDGAGDFVAEPDGRIAFREERPSAPWAYMGVQIVDPAVVAPEPLEPFSFTRIWRRLAAERRLFGAPLIGYWMHVGDPQARELAEARLGAVADAP